jgi:hypothetical protein
MTDRVSKRGLALRVCALAGTAAFALGAIFGANVGDVLAEVRQAPNSRIAMDLSENFKPSDRFAGFVDEASGASFLIVEMPGPAYDEVKTLADRPDALAQKGIVDTAKAELAGRGGEYVYLAGRQNTLAGDFAKHILILRENGVTAMITANIPQRAVDDKTVTRQQVERALATATVQAEPARGEQLFSLSYLGPFKETVSFAGTTKGYNLTGMIPEPGTAQAKKDPLFIVAPSVDKTPILDVKRSAQNSFRSLGGLADHKVTGEREITIAGLKGHEVVGEAKDPKAGGQTGVFLVLLPVQGGGYYLMAGTVASAEMAKYLPEFQKIASSFQPSVPK